MHPERERDDYEGVEELLEKEMSRPKAKTWVSQTQG